MISRSWFSRSNVRLADGDNAAAPLPLPHPTLAQQCPSCPSPTGRPDSDRLSAVERTDPPVDRSAEMSSSMDGMSEKELLDFLERQNAALEGDSKATLSIQRTSTSPPPAPPAPPTAGTAAVTADPSADSAATADVCGLDDPDHAAVGDGRTTTTTPTPEDDPEDAAIGEWIEIIANWDEKLRKKTRFVTELAHKGIPASLRGMAWQRAASVAKAARNKTVASTLLKIGTAGSEQDTDLQDEYPSLLEHTSAHEKQINRDIARTYSAENMQKHGFDQENLYNVIKAYSNFDTEVGYCQGSPFIVGVLLMHMPEPEAFAAFAILMRDFKLRGLFRPSMADLPLRLFQFDRLFRETHSELHAHFDDMLIPASSFASQWFLTLFGAVLPLPCVFRLMDVFLLEPNAHGTLTVFRAGLAILADNHDALLMSNFEGILSLLSKSALEQRYADRTDHLLKEVAKAAGSVTGKRLEKYEKEYHKAQLARAKEEGEVEVLRRKNAELEAATLALTQKIEALDDETKQLAEKLLQKSVLLNETEERLEHTEELLRDRFEADAARKDLRVQVATQTQTDGNCSDPDRASPSPRPDGDGGGGCSDGEESPDQRVVPSMHGGVPSMHGGVPSMHGGVPSMDAGLYPVLGMGSTPAPLTPQQLDAMDGPVDADADTDTDTPLILAAMYNQEDESENESGDDASRPPALVLPPAAAAVESAESAIAEDPTF